MGGMLNRMLQLGLIHRDQATRVWKSYSRQGMRLREPLDDVTPPEQPDVLRRAYEMLVKNGVLTKQQLVGDLLFDADEVQALLGLPVSFMKERTLELRLRSDGDEPGREAPTSEARVLNWRQRT